MKKILIRNIGVGSFAKLVGVANAILMFIAGTIAMFGGFVAVVEHDSWSFITKLLASVAVVVLAWVVLPILAFAFGWLYGGIVSLVANLFLQTANGLELTVEDEGPIKPVK
ncbi:MAG: hypothetical protein WBP26_00210 [Candidatus Saccharimonadales bacterium]